MDSSELFIVDPKDPQENHDRLLTFLVCVIRKYNESRQCKQTKRSGLCLLRPVKDQRIDTKSAINASLFLNSVLYYVFSESGLSAMMRDKHKRPYASNVLSALYRKSWTRECTSQRELIFKLINKTCCSVLDQSDIEFAGFVERVLLPLYLGACSSSGIPSYDPATGIYSQPAKNSILEWAASYWNAIILLDESEGTGIEIKKRKKAVIAEIRAEERPDEEVVPVATPLVTSEAFFPSETPLAAPDAVEYTTCSATVAAEAFTPQETAIQAEAPTATQLVDGFLGLFVQLQNSWSAEADSKWEEYMQRAEERLAYLQQLHDKLHVIVRRAADQVALLRSTAALFAQMSEATAAQQADVVSASEDICATDK